MRLTTLRQMLRRSFVGRAPLRLQVHTLLKGLEKIAVSADIPMLVAGDFNSTPGSAAHALLVKRSVPSSHPARFRQILLPCRCIWPQRSVVAPPIDCMAHALALQLCVHYLPEASTTPCNKSGSSARQPHLARAALHGLATVCCFGSNTSLGGGTIQDAAFSRAGAVTLTRVLILPQPSPNPIRNPDLNSNP